MSVADARTAVGIMSQFKTVANAGIFPLLTNGRPTNALTAFFKRISAEEKIVEALMHYNAVTYELTQLLLQYYEWLIACVHQRSDLITQVARLLKAMEIKTPFSHDEEGNNKLGRIFVWLDRGERMAAQAEFPKECNAIGKIKEYTGRASRKDKDEPEGPLDNPKATLHIYEYKKKVGEVELTFFYWMLKYDKAKIGEETDSLEKAAEAVYRCFYKNTTKLKFDKSLEPDYNKWIMLLGNWVTADELKANGRANTLVIPDLATDDRNGHMFVLNYPSNTKQKEKVLPKSINKTRAALMGSVNPMDFEVTLKSGTKIIGSMDWYIYRPEDRVTGEIYCAECNQATTVIAGCVCFVRGIGPMCGPCRDFAFEHKGLDDASFDVSEQVLYG